MFDYFPHLLSTFLSIYTLVFGLLISHLIMADFSYILDSEHREHLYQVCKKTLKLISIIYIVVTAISIFGFISNKNFVYNLCFVSLFCGILITIINLFQFYIKSHKMKERFLNEERKRNLLRGLQD